MFWTKRCPRCRGDLYGDRDHYGSFVACLQCGYYLGEAEEAVLRGTPRVRMEGQAMERKVETAVAAERLYRFRAFLTCQIGQ